MTDLQTILTTPGQEEHLGPNGMIHCDRCGSPRQLLLKLGDQDKTVRCLCRCQSKELEDRRKELQRREELDRYQRIRAAAMRDPALRKCTFEASQYPSEALRLAKNYTDHWPEMEKTGMGLLLWGSVGTGKTYIAACIANSLLDRGVPALMTSFGRILGAMPGPASGQQTSQLDEWMSYPLLILDDLGVERETPYTLELVYHIIDARYRSGKPMILTTNLTMAEMEHPDSREKMRIYDRILERCTPIRVDGEHIRSAKKKQNRSIARQALL